MSATGPELQAVTDAELVRICVGLVESGSSLWRSPRMKPEDIALPRPVPDPRPRAVEHDRATQQVEFLGRQFDLMAAAGDVAADQIDR